MKTISYVLLSLILISCANKQIFSCGAKTGTDAEACVFHNEIVATIPDFNKCWVKYIKEVKSNKYDMRIKLTLNKTGIIQDVEIKEGENKNINSCVAEVLDSYEFSKPSQNLTIIQPLYFKSKD